MKPVIPTQRTLFDVSAAESAREEALDRVEKGASEQEKTAAFEAVKHCARIQFYFTTDDVWQYIVVTGGPIPSEKRVMGAVMRAAMKAGYCEPTERWELSKRTACHRRPLRVWRSLIRVGLLAG